MRKLSSLPPPTSVDCRQQLEKYAVNGPLVAYVYVTLYWRIWYACPLAPVNVPICVPALLGATAPSPKKSCVELLDSVHSEVTVNSTVRGAPTGLGTVHEMVPPRKCDASPTDERSNAAENAAATSARLVTGTPLGGRPPCWLVDTSVREGAACFSAALGVRVGRTVERCQSARTESAAYVRWSELQTSRSSVARA